MSEIGREWAFQNCSTMKGDLRYSSTDAFETLPFPPSVASLASVGTRYDDHRRSIMTARREGLSATYNRFHSPDERSPDIAVLRELHAEMDRAVATAYTWTDLDLGHGFRTTRQGTRFSISDAARHEILARLLALNHERYQEEVAQGLHAKRPRKKGGAPKSRGRASGPTTGSIFD